MTNIDAKLDIWKNRLLDLGKRNKLLNYRDTRKTSLRITKPEIFNLWESFVVKEQPLKFPLWKEEIGEAVVKQEEADVITNQPVKELQSVLRGIRSKARTFMEEQGVNSLYLSFGFLRWSEKAESQQQFDAPLILVPVILNWESITSPFVLCLHEEEIVVNPTLVYKMEHDFGIKLPEFDSEKEDLKAYFDQIDNLVKVNSWRVIPDTGLAMLSFLKINMYRDLERHREHILENPVIRAIAGDTSALVQDLSGINDFDYDKFMTPEQTFQVVDADSSQQDAILCAKKGISFVLQGPPGTGKSQTITNIISECLASGKKILFVSEKMAALDVVYKRLEEANLSDFCLVLHSHKANKRAILEQLGTVLDLADKKAKLNSEAFQKLDRLADNRKKLNDYAEAIFTIIEPLHKTIYEVNGILASLSDCKEVIFSVPNIRQTTSQGYKDYINSLDRFSQIISQMSGDYRTNPWRGAAMEYVSNEFRHNSGANFRELIKNFENLAGIYEEIIEKTGYKFNYTFKDFSRAVQVIYTAADAYKIPLFWILKENVQIPLDEIDGYIEYTGNYLCFRDKIFELQRQIKELNKEVDFSSHNRLLTSIEIYGLQLAVENMISENGCYNAWNKEEDTEQREFLYEEIKRRADEYNSLQKELENLFEHEIFSIDYNAVYLRFKSEYTSLWKIFKSQYYRDKKSVQGLSREVGKKFSDLEILEVLGKLRKMEELDGWLGENSEEMRSVFNDKYLGFKTDFGKLRALMDSWELIKSFRECLEQLRSMAEEVESKENRMKEHFDFLYIGLETDWKQIRDAFAWAEAFKQILGETLEDNETFVKEVCGGRKDPEKLKNLGEKIEAMVEKVKPEFQWFVNCFESPEEICCMNIGNLMRRMEECRTGLTALEEWIDYRGIREHCCEIGLEDYMNKVDTGKIQPERIIPIFQKRFFSLWLDSVFDEFPSVANFRYKIHSYILNEFRTLDKMQFEIAKVRIRSKLIKRLPSRNHFTSGLDETSILKRELGKQRRIMPLRRLFREIPYLILTLKPCLMMSPLSVSMFLESDSFNFDTVIFDEASQVCTENAIGAIFRGKQVIIAGDSKQLPPTNFFTATALDRDFDMDEDSDNEIVDANSYESVLDEAVLLPERTLLWHYRSRHEHLIAYSNARVYKNKLVTFPSNTEKKADIGVEYIYVPEGCYDRGGKKGNVIEAKRVADLVFEHFNNFPERSLGVITFGSVQQQAIDEEIRNRRLKQRKFEKFFKEDRQDPFFIKNLENVQGDERDTIILSIGYAKDLNGVMRMQFGPLGMSGGERRLNVAITRGKYNVKLVGSILPGDIDVNRISSEGPKLLRGYIDFAINGPLTLGEEQETDSREGTESIFEKAVCRFLESKGFDVATQIGCSGYRIDIAVRHPILTEQYVMGIECDGASYHSARTARERDRLRGEVLEAMGWNIYHIWSADWIKDPAAEGEKLVHTIKKALLTYGNDSVIF